MTVQALLIGPRGHGGEGVYMESLRRGPPAGVEYESAGDFHRGAPGASCAVVREVLLNQVVHRLTIPDMGFRALRLRRPFDLVHVHAHRASLSRLRGTPVVMSEGSSSAVYLGDYLGWDPARLGSSYRRARRIYRLLGIRDRLLALEHVSRAYVFSRWARDVNLRWGADPEKLEVVYPGFETPEPVDRRGREQFTFLFVGRDFERKGGFEVVEAFEQVAAEHGHARLLLVGCDPADPNPDRLARSWVPAERRQRVLAAIDRLVRSGRLSVVRRVDQERLRREVFPAADAFVMPTHAEGFGFATVEAMSFSLPVITSPVGAGREIVHEEGSGLLVAPGDVDALTETMARLAADAAASMRTGAAARAAFLSRFTRERFQETLGDLYRRAMAA
jgi:glycosyltransferase involved in cell wall biosynthesis